MNNYFLRSTDKHLSNIINGNDFKMNNEFPIKTENVYCIGDKLYFYDDYYVPVPMKVVGRSVSGSNIWIDVIPCELSDIDPYIYGKNSTFRSDVISALNSDWVKKNVNKLELMYGEIGDDIILKIKRYATSIDEYYGIDDKSPIDHNNIWFAIEEIIADEWGVKEWHRPYRWEYSDF